MKSSHALQAFAALAQETRLEILQLLIRHGDTEVAAGEIAAALNVPAPTLSFHLNQLSAAGLIRSRRESRSILYCVDMETVRGLIDFLVQDCCEGQPERCGMARCLPEVEVEVHGP